MSGPGQEQELESLSSEPHFIHPSVTLPALARGDKAKDKGRRVPIILVVFTLLFPHLTKV